MCQAKRRRVYHEQTVIVSQLETEIVVESQEGRIAQAQAVSIARFYATEIAQSALGNARTSPGIRS